MKEFDPDKSFTKVRGMGSIHYEQDGCKFNAGHKYLGKIDGTETPALIAEKKIDVRERARAKINKKKDKPALTGFRNKEAPDVVSSAEKEDAAARQAEENA
jgi:hypothetical protein